MRSTYPLCSRGGGVRFENHTVVETPSKIQTNLYCFVQEEVDANTAFALNVLRKKSCLYLEQHCLRSQSLLFQIIVD